VQIKFLARGGGGKGDPIFKRGGPCASGIGGGGKSLEKEVTVSPWGGGGSVEFLCRRKDKRKKSIAKWRGVPEGREEKGASSDFAAFKAEA